MLEALRETSRIIHIVLGFGGLVAFWFPVFARKGGKLHVVSGNVFVACGYGVTGTALLTCTLVTAHALTGGGGLGDLAFVFFLGYLALATFAALRQAVRVVKTRRDPRALGTRFHRGLAWATVGSSFALVAYALIYRPPVVWLLLLASPIGWGVGQGILRFIDRPPTLARAWLYEHMDATLTAGIAFHTAFAVFGGARLFGLQAAGAWGFLPWVLPSALGIPAAYFWERRIRRKLGDPLPGRA